MARKYKDDSIAPIVAMDFDGTINIGENHFPYPKEVRPFAKEVINFMIDCGIKVVIYTSRDTAIDQDVLKVHDDVTPMINFLNDNNIKFSAINKSVQFAPFLYNSRKIYAHMYVDDRAYGWVESKHAMLYVLNEVLIQLCGINIEDANIITAMMRKGDNMFNNAEIIKEHLKGFWV